MKTDLKITVSSTDDMEKFETSRCEWIKDKSSLETSELKDPFSAWFWTINSKRDQATTYY